MEENKDGVFSPKTLVDNYIRLKAEVDAEYAAKIKDLTDKSAKVILGACPIDIGDVFIKQTKARFGGRIMETYSLFLNCDAKLRTFCCSSKFLSRFFCFSMKKT